MPGGLFMSALQKKTLPWFLALILGFSFDKAAWAQVLPVSVEELTQKPPIAELITCGYEEQEFSSPSQTLRLRMFGMPTGFLATPFGIVDDDDAALANDPTAAQLEKD